MRVAGLVAAVGMVVLPARAAADVCNEPEYEIRRMQSPSLWQPTTPLPAAVPYPKALVHGRSAIVVGWTPDSKASLVWSSQISPDGRLGPWVAQPQILRDAAAGELGLAAGPEHLYVVASTSGVHSRQSTYVLVAHVADDGTIGPWVETTSLPKPRMYPAVFVDAGYVYVAGGWFMGTTQDSVWRAPVRHDGTLGAWTALPALPRPIDRATVVTTDRTVYLVHGNQSVIDRTGRPSQKHIPEARRVRLATPRGAAAGRRWDVFEATAPLPSAALVAGSKGRIYAIAGSPYGCGCCGSFARLVVFHTVRTTPLAARGAAEWDYRSTLPSGRSNAAAVFSAGHLFVIGGLAGKTPLSDVLVAAEDELADVPPESPDPDLRIPAQPATAVTQLASPAPARPAPHVPAAPTRSAPPALATAPTGCGCRSSGSAPAGLVVLGARLAARRRRRSPGDRYSSTVMRR